MPSGYCFVRTMWVSEYLTWKSSPAFSPSVRAMVACMSTSPFACGQRPATRARRHIPARQYVGATYSRAE
jgi:hypothetical protein